MPTKEGEGACENYGSYKVRLHALSFSLAYARQLLAAARSRSGKNDYQSFSNTLTPLRYLPEGAFYFVGRGFTPAVLSHSNRSPLPKGGSIHAFVFSLLPILRIWHESGKASPFLYAFITAEISPAFSFVKIKCSPRMPRNSSLLSPI